MKKASALRRPSKSTKPLDDLARSILRRYNAQRTGADIRRGRGKHTVNDHRASLWRCVKWKALPYHAITARVKPRRAAKSLEWKGVRRALRTRKSVPQHVGAGG